MKRTIVITDTEVVCPYCGKPNQLDPPLLCCGEVHAETQYVDSEDNLHSEADLEALRKAGHSVLDAEEAADAQEAKDAEPSDWQVLAQDFREDT